MKNLFIIASLFVVNSVAAQNSASLPTISQNNAAMATGRTLVTAKIANLTQAHTTNDTAAFRTYARQFFGLMKTGLSQTGMTGTLTYKTGYAPGAKQHFLDMEVMVQKFGNDIKASTLNRTELLKQAKAFESTY